MFRTNASELMWNVEAQKILHETGEGSNENGKHNFIHLITSFAYTYMSIAQKQRPRYFYVKEQFRQKRPGIAHDNEIANLPAIFFSKFIFYHAYFTLTFPLIKFAFQRVCMFLIISYNAARRCAIID